MMPRKRNVQMSHLTGDAINTSAWLSTEAGK